MTQDNGSKKVALRFNPDRPPSKSCMAQSIRITKEQRAIFDAACQKIRLQEGIMATDGRCVELLSADFLAGA